MNCASILSLVLKLLSLTVLLEPVGLRAEPAPPRPKLVLVLAVDQLRADYLTRYADLFAPPVSESGGKRPYGGFRYLESSGARFVDARHTHYPLLTAPGHAVLLTGAHPYKNGIVGNYWFDPDEKHGRRYCVEDLSPLGKLIGTRQPVDHEIGISPISLQSSTVGDELRMATGGRAKVWGLALKDRAAVLMAGHLASGVAWFSENTGDWVSSRYYFETLPSWIGELNTAPAGGVRQVDTYTNQTWRFGFPAAADRIWGRPHRVCAFADEHELQGFHFHAIR